MEKKNNKHKKEEKEVKKEHCSNEECNCKEAKEECTCNEECSCGDNKLEDKIKNLEEALLRSQAELINYKRRKDEETYDLDYDDFYSIANETAWKTIMTYNSARKCKYDTYLYASINFKVKTEIRNRHRQNFLVRRLRKIMLGGLSKERIRASATVLLAPSVRPCR